jgi:hypothetical protein
MSHVPAQIDMRFVTAAGLDREQPEAGSSRMEARVFRPGAASVVAKPARRRVLAAGARSGSRHRRRLWRRRADGERRELFLDALAAT